MTTLADLSFGNYRIRQYFDGSDDYIPSAELLYIHTHPLIKPNFLNELESFINLTAKDMADRNMKGAIVNKFVQHTKALGVQLPTLTNQNAANVLAALREIYKLCVSIRGPMPRK
jgi:hypothetical protein